jgi:hypothetical protein
MRGMMRRRLSWLLVVVLPALVALAAAAPISVDR